MHAAVNSFSYLLLGKNPPTDLAAGLVTSIIVLFLVLLLGKDLWNNILVELIPAIKPAKSVWQFFGLYILIGLLKC